MDYNTASVIAVIAPFAFVLAMFWLAIKYKD